MKVLQVLPEMNAGGVERGTVDLARHLVTHGHESWVVSNGGRLVTQLEREGSTHITRAVHRKSPRSLAQVRPMRRLLRDLQPDVVHVRSRLPAWIVWLAWRRLPAASRPRLVSTFHGLYSVNTYSAVMARAEHCIAISECVREYMQGHYQVPDHRLTLIPRGVDTGAFCPGPVEERWWQQLHLDYPDTRNKSLILMPGRLSRWKGQSYFLTLMHQIVQSRPDCHGLIVGDADPRKAHYRRELEERAQELGLTHHISFLGHRQDMASLYRASAVVCHLSQKPEPFGRTVTEALACGAPVVAWNRGGAAESLHRCFTQGLVPSGDWPALQQRVLDCVAHRPEVSPLPEDLTVEAQCRRTLDVYQQLLETPAP